MTLAGREHDLGLVRLGGVDPVPASLVGYCTGGVWSYLMNRRLTYASDRPHREGIWRFTVVAAVGFGLTWLLMAVFVRGFALPYLLGQLLTSGILLFWSFAANRLWTFRGPPTVPPVALNWVAKASASCWA